MDRQLLKKIKDQCSQIEEVRDFIYWLFEESEHCDHITFDEAMKEFEEWELKQK